MVWILTRITDKIAKVIGIASATFIFLIKSIILTVVIIWTSILMYGSFYYTYMPEKNFEKEAHLQILPNHPNAKILSTTDEITYRQQTVEEEKSIYPWANVSFTRDKAIVSLTHGQAYVVELELHVPECETNRDAGMFMTRLYVYDKDGATLQHVARTATMQYKSGLLYVLETVAFSPLLIFGLQKQQQLILVQFYNDYQESPYNKSSGMFIQIMQPNLQVYSATLKIHANFTGLRYMMYYWPISTALVAIAIIIWFETLVAIGWIGMFGNRDNRPQTPEEQCRASLEVHSDEDVPISDTTVLDDSQQDIPIEPETLHMAQDRLDTEQHRPMETESGVDHPTTDELSHNQPMGETQTVHEQEGLRQRIT